MTTLISRTFQNGNSQAVRIPQEFRLDASRVAITRNEQGDLIIHPLPTDRGTALLQALSAFDDDFTALLEEDRAGQPALQEREDL